VDDFGDHNVFSYIYSTKVHKSHAMADKKDRVIELMKDQFMNNKHDPAKINESVMMQMKERNNREEKLMQDRMHLRKQKEMEAKLF
jgi:hypothetical protein